MPKREVNKEAGGKGGRKREGKVNAGTLPGS